MDERFTGIEAATAYAKVLSEDQDSPFSLTIGDGICYNSATGEMTLPGVPADDVPVEDQNRFRAYHGHESRERGFRKIPLGPIRERGEPMLATLLNAQGDVMLDKQTAEEYPGLGQHTWNAVREDSQEMLELGSMVPPSGNSISSLIRHLGEKVVTYDEAYKKLPLLQPYLDMIEDELKNLEVDDEDKIYEQAQRMYKTLKMLEEEEDPPEGESEEEGEGEGEGEGKGGSGRWPGPLPDEAPDDWNHEDRIKNRTQNGMIGNKAGSKDTPVAGRYSSDGMINRYTFNPKYDIIMEPRMLYSPNYPPSNWERDAQVLRNRMAQALTVQAPRMKRRLLKGEVDERNLHRLCIGDSDVMKRRLRQETSDVAVTLSMDMSGSMGHNETLIRHMCQIWIDALGRLGVANEVLGWYSGRRVYHSSMLSPPSGAYDKVYRVGELTHLLVKQFDQQYNSKEVTDNVAALTADGGTPTGEGLFFAAQRLVARTERRKVLFFMSDGDPALAANGPHMVHFRFTKTIADRCARSGIEVIPVALGRGAGRLAQLLKGYEVLEVQRISEVEAKLTNRLVSYLRKESLEQVRR